MNTPTKKDMHKTDRVELTMATLAAAMKQRGIAKRLVRGTMTDRDVELMETHKRLRAAFVEAEDADLGSFITLPESEEAVAAA